jgi:hypothetical protein
VAACAEHFLPLPQPPVSPDLITAGTTIAAPTQWRFDMHGHRKGPKPRSSAAVVLAVIALLILGFFAWNHYESRDGDAAAVGPAAAADIGEDVQRRSASS